MTKEAREFYIKQLIEAGYGETKQDVINYLVDRELDDMLRCNLTKS